MVRFVPLLRWLPRYQRSWLARDAVAGFTIWGLLIPEMIAYASLAGLSPQAGLYTLVASLALYAVFGTSRQLVVAGTSASAVLVFSTVTALHPSPEHFAELAAAFVVITGVLLVIAGVCRLGFVTNFLSRPVMAGFVFGLAIFVTISQLPKLFGLEKGDGDSVRQLTHVIADLADTSLVTLAVGTGALAALFVLERYAPRLPGGLLVLAVAIAISYGFDLSSHGVSTVGHIPTGLPSASWPDVKLSELWVLIPSGIGMMLVIFSEALGAGQTFADKNGYRLDPNQEMVALGLANIGSGFLKGLAAGGSLSQSAVNDGAGAQTEMSSLVAWGLAIVTVIALTPLFTDLPEAVLAALIIHAVSHLMKVGEMRRFYQLMPREFWLGILTLVGVITLDVLPALIIGMGLSILLLVYRASTPHLSPLGTDPGVPGAFADMERHPEAAPIAGVVIVRPGAPLFYANAQAVQDGVEAMVGAHDGEVSTVLLDLDANDDLDITSVETLVKLVGKLHARGVRVGIVHLHGPALDMAHRAGLFDQLDPDHVLANLAAGVEWARDGDGSGAT